LLSGRLGGSDCAHGGFSDRALAEIEKGGILEEACFPYTSGGCNPSYDSNTNTICSSLPGAHFYRCAWDPTKKQYEISYCDATCWDANSYCANPSTLTGTACSTRWNIKKWHKVKPDMNSIKRALLCHGPLSIGSDSWSHAILLVGWDDAMTFSDWPTTGGWIHKNSWGTGYGINGYGHIPYDHQRTDFYDEVFYVEGVSK
jgi:hypothetical protein